MSYPITFYSIVAEQLLHLMLDKDIRYGQKVQKLEHVTAQFTGGTLNSGTYFLPVTNAGSGWNFVGNPYSSAIDWDNLSWIKTYIDGTVYV